MTTLFERTETCSICGNDVQCRVVGSTNTFGSPDLDTRPPEMARSTIAFRVHYCPICGFCAPNLAEAPEQAEQAKQVIRSQPYQDQLREAKYPQLAARFLCSAMIQEAARSYVKAGWAAVQAAWVCDDANAPAIAAQCRSKAVQLFRGAKAHGLEVAQGGGTEEAILADLLRRSGQFEDAEVVCWQGLKAVAEGIIRQMLTLQIQLARQHDAARHTVDEAE